MKDLDDADFIITGTGTGSGDDWNMTITITITGSGSGCGICIEWTGTVTVVVIIVIVKFSSFPNKFIVTVIVPVLCSWHDCQLFNEIMTNI